MALTSAPQQLTGQALVAAYDAHSVFCFSSPCGTLRASGPYAEVPLQDDKDPAETAEALLHAFARRGFGDAAVVGALPFSAAGQGRLVVPARLERACPLSAFAQGHAAVAACPEHAELLVRRGLSRPPAAEYERAVATCLAQIEQGGMHKVVLARALELRVTHGLDVPATVKRLFRQNPEAYGYALRSDAGGRRSTFFGASPELLLAKRGGRIESNPLAGSRPRSPNGDEDAALARELATSRKDRNEHAVVVRQLAARLAPLCQELDVPSTPSLLATPTLWHLSTRITGVLKDPRASSLRVALALHPTAAICGEPTDKARLLLQDLEPFERGLFTGLVGWSDASGNGEWAVAIRAAEATDTTLRLFAGAGIVGDSQPALELSETRTKFSTILNALDPNTSEWLAP